MPQLEKVFILAHVKQFEIAMKKKIHLDIC